LNGTDYLVNIQELSTLHFPVFEAIKYDMKAFNLMRGEEDDDQSPVVMERETAVTSNRKAMTEEVIDCWINIWDMQSRDAAIPDVILRFKISQAAVSSNQRKDRALSNWKREAKPIGCCCGEGPNKYIGPTEDQCFLLPWSQQTDSNINNQARLHPKEEGNKWFSAPDGSVQQLNDDHRILLTLKLSMEVFVTFIITT
jgi:hypothetical protein